MTDNEIIKAFELCFAKRGTILTCGKCPYHNFGKLCKVKRDKDALDLIKRQKAEIENKNREIDILIRKKETLRDKISALCAEIERLKTRNDELNALNKTASIEAIKGFKDGIYACLNILTEMVGETE